MRRTNSQMRGLGKLDKEPSRRDPRAARAGAPSEPEAHPSRRGEVAPESCIGCGICEHECPVKDDPAFHVTAIGETRDKSRSERVNHSSFVRWTAVLIYI